MSLMIHGDSGGDYRLCYPVSAHWSTQAPTNQSTSQSPKTRAKSQSRASPQVIDPPTKPPALNNLPVAEAKGGLPLANPKGDGSIISRLKKAIIIKTDMGVEQRLDKVKLGCLPEVEEFLENSHPYARYDYYAGEQSLVITKPSHIHECGVNAVRQVFEPAMQKCAALYGIPWPYHTNCAYPLFQDGADGPFPTGDVLTPDGAIPGGGPSLGLAVEVASSQQLKAAWEKMQTYFKDPSVKAGIILNIEEFPAYAAPKLRKDWEWDQKFATYQGWPKLENGAWGPINFLNHRWGGEFSCQMEVHWPGNLEADEVATVMASLIPLGPELDIEDLNAELAAVWSALHEKVFGDRPSAPPEATVVSLDADLFQCHLAEELRLTTYNWYAAAFAEFNPKSKALADSSEQAVRDRLYDAARIRVLANQLKRKERVGEAVAVAERPSKVTRMDSPKN